MATVGVGSEPARFGAGLSFATEDDLAGFDVSGCTPGTIAYVEEDEAWFALKASTADLDPGAVVAVAGIDDARWLVIEGMATA